MVDHTVQAVHLVGESRGVVSVLGRCFCTIANLKGMVAVPCSEHSSICTSSRAAFDACMIILVLGYKFETFQIDRIWIGKGPLQYLI